MERWALCRTNAPRRFASDTPVATLLMSLFAATFLVAGCGEDEDPSSSAQDSGRTWIERTPIGVEIGSAVAVTPDDWLIVSGRSGGVYRSHDGVGSWFPKALDQVEVHSVAVLGPEVFAGIGYGEHLLRLTGGLYRSTDWGRTWELVAFERRSVSVLAASDSELYVSSRPPLDPHDGSRRTAVYRSDDMGRSWHEVLRGVGSVAAISTDGSATLVVARRSPDDVLLRSSDGEEPWTPILSETVGAISVAGNHIVCSLDYGVSHKMVYSADGGDTWFDVEGLRSGSDTLLLDGAIYDGLGDSVARWRFVGSPRQAHSPDPAERAKAWNHAYFELGMPDFEVEAVAASDNFLYVFDKDGRVVRARRPV